MASLVIMPRQGQSVESCIVSEWKVKVGDKVAEGDILFTYETDKSSFEEKAKESGTVLAVFCSEGEDVPCLDPVCVIGNPGEDYSSLIPGKEGVEPEAVKTEAPAAQEEQAEASPTGSIALSEERIKISPRARRFAERTDADISKAVPTGPNGRIIERDINTLLDKGLTISAAASEEEKPAEPVVAAASASAPQTEYEDVKIPNIRKVIAKSMHDSLSNMAQLTLNTTFDATQIQEYRNALKSNAESLGLANITLNDMVCFGVAKTILNFRDLNAHWLDDTQMMRYFKHCNLGIAVDTPRGLLVVTVPQADKLTLNEFSVISKQIISEAQSGNISPDKLKGATFTVTNLGSLGIESFTPVINPPQTGILGVNTITRRSKVVDGKDVFYNAMGLSLTFDHRAIDGAPAAKFLKELVKNLENFNLLLAK
ncbi:MAG: 2-oxo acid dehydrogenase subunit E2 [Clostridiales bacterium]|jgi:pyruvate dehydrogenase E2 component (dihydrolipoamide acetyltransferase)|nr:2-oxo acid dehydrogenase subunit E2 [Clostridiales bacterium]